MVIPFASSFGLNEKDQNFFRLILRKSFETNFESYIGIVNGETVSCGSISYHGAIPVIYNIGTHPDNRGNGYATAMVQFLMSAVYERNYESVGLFATDAGLNLYKRLGFETVSWLESCVIE